jgi:hypothetical protein
MPPILATARAITTALAELVITAEMQIYRWINGGVVQKKMIANQLLYRRLTSH